MRIESRDLISRSTETSARALVSVSAVVAVIQIFHLNQDNWVLFEQDIPPNVVAVVMPYVLTFMFVGHLLHFLADHSSFRNWFHESEVAINSIGGLGSAKNTESPLLGLSRRVKQLSNRAQELNDHFIHQPDNDAAKYEKVNQSINNMNASFTECLDLLEGVSGKHQLVVGPAAIMVYGWYFFVPVCAYIVALLSLVF